MGITAFHYLTLIVHSGKFAVNGGGISLEARTKKEGRFVHLYGGRVRCLGIFSLPLELAKQLC